MSFWETLLYLELEMVGGRLIEGTLFKDGVLILNHFPRSLTAAALILRASVDLDYSIYNTIYPKQNSSLTLLKYPRSIN
jgi:hypothetical protein